MTARQHSAASELYDRTGNGYLDNVDQEMRSLNGNGKGHLISNEAVCKRMVMQRWLLLLGMGTFAAVVLALAKMGKPLALASFFPITSHKAKVSLERNEFVNTQPPNQYRCLQEDGLEEQIKKASQIIVAMPAKAAGSTMKSFTEQCMRTMFPDNFLNSERDVIKTLLLGDPVTPPKIISSHMYTDSPLINLIQQLPRSVLLIYIHREETERLKSAINEVYSLAKRRFCNSGIKHEGENTTCHVGEKSLIATIKAKAREIGYGDSQLLSCNTHFSIRENAPNMLFAHYKQAGRLQRLLAKYHCPDLLEKEVRANVADDKKVTARVQIGRHKEVDLKDWVDAKADTLQFALQLREPSSCQSLTRKMEDRLFECDVGFVRPF